MVRFYHQGVLGYLELDVSSRGADTADDSGMTLRTLDVGLGLSLRRPNFLDASSIALFYNSNLFEFGDRPIEMFQHKPYLRQRSNTRIMLSLNYGF